MALGESLEGFVESEDGCDEVLLTIDGNSIGEVEEVTWLLG